MGLRVERLLTGNETFYGEDPTFIAATLEQALNRLEGKRFDIVTIEELPDFHNMGDDGGTKDILIGATEKTPQSLTLTWSTALLNGEGTMHGWQTPEILDLLQLRITEIEADGFEVRHFLSITDHHRSAGLFGEGVGGFDGVKDMILCYHPRRDLPR